MASHLCGVYRAVCKDISDPEQRDRIRVSIPAVFGDATLNYWAWPVRPPVAAQATHPAHTISSAGTDSHTHAITAHSKHASHPNVNDGVWVMFEGGRADKPVWLGVI